MLKLLGFLESFLESGVLVPGLALCFGFYVAYVLLSARRVVPMSRDEAEKLWRFHRQTKCCNAQTRHGIEKKNKLIGFECECGHKHIQKKHLVTVG